MLSRNAKMPSQQIPLLVLYTVEGEPDQRRSATYNSVYMSFSAREGESQNHVELVVTVLM